MIWSQYHTISRYNIDPPYPTPFQTFPTRNSTVEEESNIVIFKKHIIYKNVYDFKDRINIYKLHYSNKEVKNLILICLRDDVLK